MTPVGLALPNPSRVRDDWWVVYPFVAGRAYAAQDLGDVRAAGSLLGRIHSTPLDTEEGAWVLEYNDDGAWADPRQGAYLRDLATINPARFSLPH
ncbi:hypothetical protein [Pseudactinotalea sp. Z1748]|uniref:hypothetical protein n=1 Tax=Pseudactinotalea sp. Z1748 TaxID=3413027 RepID=UPI003C7DFC6A